MPMTPKRMKRVPTSLVIEDDAYYEELSPAERDYLKAAGMTPADLKRQHEIFKQVLEMLPESMDRVGMSFLFHEIMDLYGLGPMESVQIMADTLNGMGLRVMPVRAVDAMADPEGVAAAAARQFGDDDENWTDVGCDCARCRQIRAKRASEGRTVRPH